MVKKLLNYSTSLFCYSNITFNFERLFKSRPNLVYFLIGLTEDKDNSTCETLTKSDYINIIWTTTAEIPGMHKQLHVRMHSRIFIIQIAVA